MIKKSVDTEPPARTTKVLVIEDEWIVATDLQRTLRRAGYAVDEIVTAGARALGAFGRIRPDLVLLDISLDRELDGIEIATQIRARSSVPIVFLSAHCDPVTLRGAMRASPQGFVVKPFTEAQLLTALQLALNAETSDDDAENARQTLRRIATVLAEAGQVPGFASPLETAEARVPELSTLTAREREILSRLLDHQRVAGIARGLEISEHTVRNHLKSIYTKLGVHSQEELLQLVVDGAGRSAKSTKRSA